VRIASHSKLPHVDDNLYYPAEGSMFELDAGKSAGFTERQAAVSGDTKPLLADPQFEDAVVRGCRLHRSSPASGLDMGVDALAKDGAADE
jgi:hypothetical protein